MLRLTHLIYISIIGLISSTAFADIKNYSAVECVQRDASGTLDYDLGGARISNAHSSQSLNIVCPIVRDGVFSTDVPAKVNSARVTVLDPHISEDVECAIQVRRRAGGGSGYFGFKQVRSTSGFSSDWQDLEFTNVGPASDPEGIYYMYLECTLPDVDNGRSRVISYQIDE